MKYSNHDAHIKMHTKITNQFLIFAVKIRRQEPNWTEFFR